MEHIAIKSSFSKTEFRTLIKFFFLQTKNAHQIQTEITAVLGDTCPSLRTIQRWLADFEKGRISIEDEERSGRPSTELSEKNIQLIQEKIEEDRRVTLRQLAEDTGLSYGTVERIVTTKLHLKRLVAKWIPHVLTTEQKNNRLWITRQHLKRFRKEGEKFLERIVAGDETWCRSFEPELKSQSSEWHHRSSPRPQKAKRSQGSLKVMHVIFYDYLGILLDWPVPRHTSVNGDYYLWVLQEKLRPAIRKKRPELLKHGVILLHDNAAPHWKKTVVELLDSWDWEILSHPPYSPDLSPCDFHLFTKLKNLLRGNRYKSEEEVNQAVATVLRQLQNEGFCNGLKKLVERWSVCIEREGNYVE